MLPWRLSSFVSPTHPLSLGCAHASQGAGAKWVALPLTLLLNISYRADNQQQALYAQLQQQQMQRKIDKTQEQCRKKLIEVHNGYTTVTFAAWLVRIIISLGWHPG